MQGTGTVVGEWRFRIASARGHGSRPGERRRSRLLWPAPRALLCSWAGRMGYAGNLAGDLRRPSSDVDCSPACRQRRRWQQLRPAGLQPRH